MCYYKHFPGRGARWWRRRRRRSAWLRRCALMWTALWSARRASMSSPSSVELEMLSLKCECLLHSNPSSRKARPVKPPLPQKSRMMLHPKSCNNHCYKIQSITFPNKGRMNIMTKKTQIHYTVNVKIVKKKKKCKNSCSITISMHELLRKCLTSANAPNYWKWWKSCKSWVFQFMLLPITPAWIWINPLCTVSVPDWIISACFTNYHYSAKTATSSCVKPVQF